MLPSEAAGRTTAEVWTSGSAQGQDRQDEMAKHGNRAGKACGGVCMGFDAKTVLNLALCLSLMAGAAVAETASQRPKPRPALATAPENTAADIATEAGTPDESESMPTDKGTDPTAPLTGNAAGPDSEATPPLATDAPALAAPTTAKPPAPTEAKPKPPPRDPNRGPITDLPMPRYVSLKGKEGNARRGPGLTNRIDWVFVRAGMPLRITGEYEHWRRIEDAEGAGGWVHYSLLSGVRSAQVVVDMAEFHDTPNDDAAVRFKAEKDVIGWIQECVPDWCRLSIDGEKGWVRKTALWGVDPGEVVE